MNLSNSAETMELKFQIETLQTQLDVTTRALNLHEIELMRAFGEITELKGDLKIMDDLLAQKGAKRQTTSREDQEDVYFSELAKRLYDMANYHAGYARYRGASQEWHERCQTTATDAADGIQSLRLEVKQLKGI